MRVPPRTDEYYPPLLLIRTDYRDADGWQRVRTALDRPWVFDEDGGDEGRLTEEIHCVDDPGWADSTPSDVLSALTAAEDGEGPAECGWEVVFLADRASMEGAEPTLLAMSPDPAEETRPYRVPALETPHLMHCNLALGNTSFGDHSDEPLF